MGGVRAGEVAWYVTGRFYVNEEQRKPGVSTVQDVGYFLLLQGVDGKLFTGAPGEGTARLTFASEPFAARGISNGGLAIALDDRGEFSLYFNREPAATFDDPASFAAGDKIATFRRVSVVVGTSVATTGPNLIAMNVFTARLVSSRPFELDGGRYDLGELLPHGITQWGTAATEPVLAPLGYASIVPFVGSGVATAG
jgi:hypothetical protein